LIHYSVIYCRGRYSLKELGEMMNLSAGGYSSCRRAIQASLFKNKSFNMRMEKLKTKLDNVKC